MQSMLTQPTDLLLALIILFGAALTEHTPGPRLAPQGFTVHTLTRCSLVLAKSLLLRPAKYSLHCWKQASHGSKSHPRNLGAVL